MVTIINFTYINDNDDKKKIKFVIIYRKTLMEIYYFDEYLTIISIIIF